MARLWFYTSLVMAGWCVGQVIKQSPFWYIWLIGVPFWLLNAYAVARWYPWHPKQS